jgi:hypothetical protein
MIDQHLILKGFRYLGETFSSLEDVAQGVVIRTGHERWRKRKAEALTS